MGQRPTKTAFASDYEEALYFQAKQREIRKEVTSEEAKKRRLVLNTCLDQCEEQIKQCMTGGSDTFGLYFTLHHVDDIRGFQVALKKRMPFFKILVNQTQRSEGSAEVLVRWELDEDKIDNFK